MMCTKRYSILSILLLLVLNLSAQNIRYVSKSGAYANNGLSWATAKINIQDAINDLVNSGLTGEVWVAEGTYTPTESTESTGGSTLYMSFKIPAGITVRGGFRGQVVDGGGNVTYAGEATAADRVMESQDGEGHAYQNLDKYYKYRTILSGNLSSPAEFRWNNAKKQYETTFYGNCYHVVWFAMNGFDSNGRAKALSKEAKLEGCVITNGHAYNTSLTERQHNAFGGGAYMVPNSTMENVFVLNCDASRDGGGIYMDGGGLVRKCFVADCQALGIGVENGFGGGIFMDGNGKQHGIVTQSGILNCVARMGGGLAIKNGTGSDDKTYLSAFATMVNNNTATTEGGGVYIMNGGALGNLTIVRNQCNGTGVISNGMTTGRAGGLYCRDQAIIANSIIWGNEVAKNSNIQYASSRSSASNDKKPRMQYCGIAKSDYIDWSGTSKKGIISLAESNSGSHTSSEGLALFTTPTPTSGHIDGLATSTLTTYNWQLQSESSLHDAGIQLIDLDLNQETDAPAVGRDINNETYHPHCTLGAFVSPNYNIAPAESSEEFSFYVDPEFIFSVHTDDAKGMSWDSPTRFLGNVLELIRQDAATQADVEAGRATKVGAHLWTTGKKINIYVKSGTVDNTNSFVSGRLRTISLNVPSNVNIYGSYDRSLEGTDLSKRNPVLTPTVISARLMDDYSLNVAHIITLDGVHDVTIDGFKISYANAHSTLLASTNQDGAALTIKNSTTNIHLRNLVVSNNQANHGAAVYADGSTADFENCIFHNNTSNNTKNSGLIYAINSSSLTFEHCNVLRSVGHASYVDATSHNVWNNSMFYGNLKEAQDNTNNCAELSIEAFDGTVANISGTQNMADMKSKTAYPTVFGDIPGASAYNANALNYTYQSGVANGYPRMVNPTKNAGVSPNGDVTYYGRATSFEPHNDNPVVNMASFSGAHSGTSTDNSWGYDITTIVTRDYGGLPDIGAVESHQSTSHQSILGDENENANADGQRPYGAITYVRDYSHNGDVAMTDASWTGTKKKTYDHDGANYTENHQGKGKYVKDGDTYILLDGMSWKYAINGNATYTESSTTEHNAATAYTVEVSAPTQGTTRLGYKIRTSNNEYLCLNGTTLSLTTNSDQANIWVVSGKASTDISTGAKTLSTIVNGTPYYLVTTSNAPAVSTTQTNITIGGNSTSGYTLYLNRYYYVNNGVLQGSRNNATRWFFDIAYNQIPGSTTETAEDSPVYNGTEIVLNAVVSPEGGTVAHKLHVYADVENLKKTNDPVAYRLGMFNGNTYYAYNNTGSVLNSTTTHATGDKFAFVKTNEENKYYIYNVTQGKFVIYTATSQSAANANIIQLSETATTSNGTWWVVPSQSRTECVNIIPGTLTVGGSTVNWNYYGGSGNQLGLYNRTDANSQWRIEAAKAYTPQYKVIQSHASTTKNGLQHAVDMAHERLGLGTRTTPRTENYGNGSSKTVTLTYHDLPVGMEDGVVWVGAGIYTESKGYEIRNHVKVLGAFPKEGDPAIDQRHPQLSEGIALSKKNQEQNLKYKDFETILETHTTKGQKTNVTSVLTHPVECRVTLGDDSNEPANRVIYEGAEWDGFTIRYGYKHGVTGGGGGRRNSGAGVSMYENVVLRNCVVRDNYLDTGNGRSAGIYCDGSSIENCYILDNVSNCPNENFGGGVYMIQGTMFNSVIAGNSVGTAGPRGAGIFLESAKFYNNTIVNNTGGSAIGIYTASKATADLTVYNSIVIAGPGQVVLQRQSTDTPTDFVNCLLKSDQANGSGVTGLTGTDYVTLNSACHTYLNQDLANNNPFVLPYSEAVSNYDYRINFKTTGGVVDDFNCVNAGTEDLGAKITLPDNDMDWTERIQDCRVDIGAYEYNGSYDISPDITSVSGQAIYYVTPEGKGTSSAKDPENAACASKLQKVIDAAGRYKYLNPGVQVIVKVANSYDLYNNAVKQNETNNKNPGDDGYIEPTNFEYYATRTTNQTSTDTRLWSIIIPRGVEVWGGYTDANSDSSPWTNSKNGFQTRDVVGNPTYFASSFYNREAKINAITYHVVTFTDYVYDADGHPYMKGDEAALAAGQNGTYLQKVNTSGSLSDDAVLLMSDRVNTSASAEAATIAGNTEYISTRAVLDGIFVSGGKADGKDFVGETTAKNVNGYGGAAIVTDYAHVRNCILKGNNATYGGALALKERALVSGCLMLENSADQRGGALYVFENGDELSDGSTINTAQGGGATMDTNMSHVFTSTIVNNHAEQGGGVWFSDDEFTPNVRFSSVVIWQNQATDQANVSGNAMPNKPLDDKRSPEEYYPFAYSAIQNIRAAGTNNISLEGENKRGARFSDKNIDLQDPSIKRTTIAVEAGDEPKLRNFGYYGLTNYSMLTHTGMPKTQYETLIEKMAVAKADFTSVARDIPATNNQARTYLEIGARAIKKVMPAEKLMLRLFVTEPAQVDMDAAQKMMDLGNKVSPTEEEQYYAQEGSSFAYPFQSLQDALDYVIIQRHTNHMYDDQFVNRNLPFEICVTGGTYHPTRDLSSHYGESLANTFIVPEGVGIYGGFAIDELGANTFYGAGNTPKSLSDLKAFTAGSEGNAHWIFGNVDALSAPNQTLKEKETDPEWTLDVKQLPIEDMLAARKKFDVNANNIIEPWEFLNQTILSGNTTNAENIGVYHVITSVADENVVGMLPIASVVHGHYEDHLGDDPACMGYEDHEEGQTIRLNGITVTGGYARHYTDGSLDDYGKYIYYQGGGLQVDGNRYNDNCNKYVEGQNANPALKHPAYVDGLGAVFNENHRAAYAVGYRDIPVSITNCEFVNNSAGYGGAISSNGTIDIFASSFEQNLAIEANEDVPVKGESKPFTVQYPGEGGAILATHQLSVFNTMFENNEARSDGYRIDPHVHKSFRVQDPDNVGGVKSMDAAGGAIMMGTAAKFHIVNCDFVKNKANMYPAIFTLNPDKHPLQDPDAAAKGRENAYKMAYAKTFGTRKALGDNDAAADAAATTAAETAYAALSNDDDAIQHYYENIQTPDYSQVINSVFWGNEVHPEMLRQHAGNETFMTASKLVVNVGLKGRNGAYNPSFVREYAPTPSYDKYDLLNSSINDCRFQEMVWFSAYEDGCGFKPMNDYDCRDLDYKPFGHAFYQVQKYLKDTYPTRKTGYNYQNCNILLDSDNGSLEGPNFVNPSHNAGIDGYLEAADWSPARLNNLTDNGSGRIMQTIATSGENYLCTFDKYAQDSDVPGDRALYSSEKAGSYITKGAYTMTHYINTFPEYQQNLSLGDDYYMESAYDLPTYDAGGNVVPDVYTHQKLLRISYDPNPTHNQTYIDMGVYEYPHTELKFHTEDECDILWVSSAEKPDNGLPEGSAWTQPTSDLQRAIETLLASRNGHRKEIRLMDGTFTPIYTIDGHLSFYIDTYYQNSSVTLPDYDKNDVPDYDLGVTSFTIKGGYSRDLNNQYDVNLYPAVIKGQNRTDESSDRWDHLFYIKDATQRYGKQEYNETNAYGAKINASTPIATIPIEIDGVTLINDQAKPDVNGAAIYFEDQARTIDEHAYQSSGASTSHISVFKYYTDEKKTTPSPDNAPTLYYDREEISAGTYPYADNSSTAKYIMSKCTVYGSGSYNNLTNDPGDKKNTTSAVYIGKYGGHALLFNNVFHSNYGNPLVAYNAVTVNNTFGQNRGGFVDLKNDASTSTVPSSIKNSVLWCNNWSKSSSAYLKQFNLADYTGDNASATIFDHNAYTGASFNGTDYAALDSHGDPSDIAKVYYNVNLANENSDVIYGPNFIDPENSDLSKRNYMIMPSLRLLNKGDNNLYKDNVTVVGQDYLTPVANPSHAFNTSANIYDQAWITTTQHDAASSARFVNRDIDLGAYEYQQDLDRVIYVDPNKTVNGSGKDWSSPLGYGMIQDAIDLAAVYVVNHQNDGSGKEAYVFVKGASGTNKGLHTGETITPRNGVQVYGSIGADYSDIAKRSLKTDPIEKATEDDAFFDEFVNDMLAQREGVASNAASKTTISGIHTNGTGFGTEQVTLVDGFDVTATTASNADGVITEPVISIKPLLDGSPSVNPANTLKLALRNIIVHDNDASASPVNVAEVDNALIYEVLMRDNKVDDAHSVLKLGTYGWLVNGTVEGKTTGSNNSTALNGGVDAAAEAASHVYYSLVNYGDDEPTWKTLSGYNYPVDDKNLNYQLAENSKHIDAIEPVVPTLPTPLRGFINYNGDRDILGNPRYLRLLNRDEHDANQSMLDRGAFETWKVESDFICGTNGTVKGRGITDLAPQFYPHDGSVVYIMAGKSLVIDPVDEFDIKPTAHNPGYMLLQEGASCYGNGRPITCSYLAVERKVKKTAGAVVSLPYTMDYRKSVMNTANETQYVGVAVPQTDANGILTLHADAPTVYTYDGNERSDWQYTFAKENSDCWKTVSKAVEANNAVLYVVNDGTVDNYGIDTDADDTKDCVTLRFTGKGADMSDYIYTESGVSKTVTLTQYNDGGRDTHENGNTDDNADFTDSNDMGWNAIGLPYLVSQYQPYNTVTVDAEHNSVAIDASVDSEHPYQMHIPHTFWMWYDGKKYADGTAMTPGAAGVGDGGFYTVNSWDNTNALWHVGTDAERSIWVGEGFFTQTAKLEPTETLTFYRPVAPTSFSVTPVKTERWYMTDEVRNIEETTGRRIVATRYYTPDGILQAKPVKGITIQVDFYDDGSQKSHKYLKR